MEKTVKIKMKLPQVNIKPVARKRIFVQTPFSHSTLNLSKKNSRHKNTRFFSPLPVSAWLKSLLKNHFEQFSLFSGKSIKSKYRTDL